MPTANEILAELEQLGKESFRKTYRRHGAAETILGVSTADLKAMQKRIKTDHELARALWVNGSYEARLLATMIADPKAADEAMLEEWLRDLDSYPLVDAFAAFVSRTKVARSKADQWIKSKQEWTSSAGWHVIAHLAMIDEQLNDEFFGERLEIIRRDIEKAPNRTRHNMNGALIAIGVRNAKLGRLALSVAEEVGPVEVDHGETACTTPDARAYILKVRERQKKKSS